MSLANDGSEGRMNHAGASHANSLPTRPTSERDARRTGAPGCLLKLAAFVAFAAVAPCIACGGAPSKFPARPEGCDVKTFADAPRVQTENIGTVSSVCDESVTDESCLRQLKDETCKLGGDVVWGVPDKPKLENGKKRYSGRAAHTADRPAKK